MCVSALTAAALAAGGTAVATSMLSKSPSTNLPDPAAERAKAEADAAAKTNAQAAARNKSRAASSLLAKPLDSATSDVTALGGGKTTLGQ